MSRVRRGYITFLLLIQWAYLLLIPFLFLPTPTTSLLPAYSTQRLLAEEVAFKRAARAAAADDFYKITLASKTGQDVAEFFDIPPESYHQLTHAQIQRAARQLILHDWTSLSLGWANETGFNASLSCPPLTDCGSLIVLSRNSSTLSLKDGIQVTLNSVSSNLKTTSPLPPGDVNS